jgi:hypothetical protein
MLSSVFGAFAAAAVGQVYLRVTDTAAAECEVSAGFTALQLVCTLMCSQHSTSHVVTRSCSWHYTVHSCRHSRCQAGWLGEHAVPCRKQCCTAWLFLTVLSAGIRYDLQGWKMQSVTLQSSGSVGSSTWVKHSVRSQPSLGETFSASQPRGAHTS